MNQIVKENVTKKVAKVLAILRNNVILHQKGSKIMMMVDIEHASDYSEILDAWMHGAHIHVWDEHGDYLSEAILDFEEARRDLQKEVGMSFHYVGLSFESSVPKDVVDLYVETFEKHLPGLDIFVS